MAAPGPAHDHHDREQRGDDNRVEDEPEPQAEAPHQRTGKDSEEEDVCDVEHCRVPGEEPSQVVSAVLRCRAIEEEEVDDLRPHRGQHLIDENEENEARSEQRPQWRPGECRRLLGGCRAYLRESPLGSEH